MRSQARVEPLDALLTYLALESPPLREESLRTDLEVDAALI